MRSRCRRGAAGIAAEASAVDSRADEEGSSATIIAVRSRESYGPYRRTHHDCQGKDETSGSDHERSARSARARGARQRLLQGRGPGPRVRDHAGIFFFFKQKTAYEI